MMIMNRPCSIAVAMACLAFERTTSAQLSSVAVRKRLRHGRHAQDNHVFWRQAMASRFLEIREKMSDGLAYSSMSMANDFSGDHGIPLVFSVGAENYDQDVDAPVFSAYDTFDSDSTEQPVEINFNQSRVESMLAVGEKCISDVQGCASSSANWLASLPPGLALAILTVGVFLLFALLYMCCCCKRKISLGKDSVRTEDEPCFDTEGAANLSYVGRAIHSTLQKYHSRHRRTMWNLTSGRVVGQLDYTPRNVWDTSSDPGEVHDYWFPEKLAKIIGQTKSFCDIMTLGPPDGIFTTLISSVLHLLALRSKSAQSPISVRIMFGHYPLKPVDCTEVIKTLTKNLPQNANLHIWVGAWRRGLTWNHAKFIAVDGHYLHTGGHNMWELPYLKRNPIHDLSVEMEGAVARDAHLFADQQWKFVKERQRMFLGSIVNKLPDNLPLLTHTRVTVSEWPPKVATTFPPFFTERTGVIRIVNHVKMDVNIGDKQKMDKVSSEQLVLEGFELECEFEDTPSNAGVPMISIGRQGSMVSHARPSDDAILSMIESSQQNLALVIQDLGPVCVPGTTRAVPGLNWPKEYLTAIGNAIYERGVDVEIVLSNPRSMPGGLDRNGGLRLATPYGNGWDCVDVACEIIKSIQREHSSVDDAKLRAMITDNLRICFIRHNKSSTYSDGNSIGLHTKHFIVDGRCCYIGSQNLYDSDLAEWGVVIDDADEVRKIQEQYFVPMWRNSFIPGLDVDVQRVMDGLGIDRDG